MNLTDEQSKEQKQIKKAHRSVFNEAELLPLSFVPHDDDIEAVSIARRELHKRNDADISYLSAFIFGLIDFGEDFAFNLMLQKPLGQRLNRVRLLQARTLFTLRQYFSLEFLRVENLKPTELFAVLVLTQAAQKIMYDKHQAPENSEDEFALSLWHAEQAILNELPDEQIDSLARLECLIAFEESVQRKMSHAGKGNAKNIAPLIQEVLRFYISECSAMNNKQASEHIFEKLKSENPKLLLLSHAEPKSLQFAKWIAKFRKGELAYQYKK